MTEREIKWESLSREERSVLLAIAFELPQVQEKWVKGKDVLKICPLSEALFWETVVRLESRALLKREPSFHRTSTMLCLDGDAVSLVKTMITAVLSRL